MALKVILSEPAEQKLDEIVDYLENNWGNKTKNRFLKQFTSDIENISEYPRMFPESVLKRGVRRCILNKYNIMYYRVKKDSVEIITIHSARQDPDSINL